MTFSVALGAVAVIAAGLLVRANSGTVKSAAADKLAASSKVTAATVSPPKSWKLTFNSGFSGTKLNTRVWATCYPWAKNGCTNFGNDGEEKEWYTASQDKVTGGVLDLVAQREKTAGVNAKGAPEEYSCRSGMATTFPGFKFEYGYVQVIARLPFKTGLWPAFWLAASNEKWPPEIDLMEHWAFEANARVYLHPLSGIRQGGEVSTPGLSGSGWHSFTLYWTKTRITWYYDGHQLMTTTTGIPKQSMYFIANLASYDDTAGTCSGTLQIKSVKVWQP